MITQTDREIIKRLARHNMKGLSLSQLVCAAQDIISYLDELICAGLKPETLEGERLYHIAWHQYIMNEIERRQTMKYSGIIYTNENAIQLIKSQIDIEDVLSWYVEITSGGGRNRRQFKCTKHGRDKAPSGTIYLDQNSWWCYGCNKGSTIFDAVMWYEDQDFLYALRKLANYIGIDLTDHSLKAHPHPKSTEERLKGLEKAIGNHLQSRSDKRKRIRGAFEV